MQEKLICLILIQMESHLIRISTMDLYIKKGRENTWCLPTKTPRRKSTGLPTCLIGRCCSCSVVGLCRFLCSLATRFFFVWIESPPSGFHPTHFPEPTEWLQPRDLVQPWIYATPRLHRAKIRSRRSAPAHVSINNCMSCQMAESFLKKTKQ